jgi:protein ImuB
MATQLSFAQHVCANVDSYQEPARRVVCLVLPELAVELARWSRVKPAPKLTRAPNTKANASAERGQLHPLGVVLLETSERTALAELNRQLDPNAKLSAVDGLARQLGITEGQSLVEARCLCSRLEVRALPRPLLQKTLEHLAETLLDRASIVAVEAPDSIWLEIGPVVRALGGEETLKQELLERVRCLGHSVSLAIAEGPRLAQLFARHAYHSHSEGVIVPASATQREIQKLPLTTLPFAAENLGWLGRLGLITLGDLARLPQGELVDRLGNHSEKWVQLAQGVDPEPLVPLAPTRVLKELLEWDEPLDGLERMRFILRRLTQNIEARLQARGEAAEHLRITFNHDRATARHRGVPFESQIKIELNSPLWYAEELERILVLRCEKVQLGAPVVSLEIAVIDPVPKVPKQLSLSRLFAGFGGQAPADDGIPLLLAELENEIGTERVGQLAIASSHRPEKRSLFAPCRLEPVSLPRGKNSKRTKSQPGVKKAAPLPRCPAPVESNTHFSQLTRLLDPPVPLTPPLRIGSTLFVGKEPYVIQSLRFEQRLENVEWWTDLPITRDYLRLWLKGATGGLEVLAYIDKPQGRCFLQAVAD